VLLIILPDFGDKSIPIVPVLFDIIMTPPEYI